MIIICLYLQRFGDTLRHRVLGAQHRMAAQLVLQFASLVPVDPAEHLRIVARRRAERDAMRPVFGQAVLACGCLQAGRTDADAHRDVRLAVLRVVAPEGGERFLHATFTYICCMEKGTQNRARGVIFRCVNEYTIYHTYYVIIYFYLYLSLSRAITRFCICACSCSTRSASVLMTTSLKYSTSNLHHHTTYTTPETETTAHCIISRVDGERCVRAAVPNRTAHKSTHTTIQSIWQLTCFAGFRYIYAINGALCSLTFELQSIAPESPKGKHACDEETTQKPLTHTNVKIVVGRRAAARVVRDIF